MNRGWLNGVGERVAMEGRNVFKYGAGVGAEKDYWDMTPGEQAAAELAATRRAAVAQYRAAGGGVTSEATPFYRKPDGSVNWPVVGAIGVGAAVLLYVLSRKRR